MSGKCTQGGPQAGVEGQHARVLLLDILEHPPILLPFLAGYGRDAAVMLVQHVSGDGSSSRGVRTLLLNCADIQQRLARTQCAWDALLAAHSDLGRSPWSLSVSHAHGVLPSNSRSPFAVMVVGPVVEGNEPRKALPISRFGCRAGGDGGGEERPRRGGDRYGDPCPLPDLGGDPEGGRPRKPWDGRVLPSPLSLPGDQLRQP